ncbi:MAG: DEAD/DEAH box helicase [Candidatus Spechtbacteria bacterium SB0662_bin_43]|uniref:DEAD/DEAH box helicase n=1 Tax=Candidatus Spechtbacteria bacterium SB0662_bin_43 TaxID=2604897 RepID=A0A845DA44_9BACT|nr:DEAD/DEAH box helicase [Candidatus Spechtbacteria bacterium SB0662_bin_43]
MGVNQGIEIDIQHDSYVLTGDIDLILSNRRMVLSLNRLLCEKREDKLSIPYSNLNKSKEYVLQEIEELLQKFQIDYKLSDTTEGIVIEYRREKENFADFSKKAFDIRNDKFQDNPDLVRLFEEFAGVVKFALHRNLYPLQLLSAFHIAFSQNACNFSVPGAGKTSIVYGAYAYLKDLNKDSDKYVDKILVIGPLSSFAPWENEYRECFGKEVKSQRLSGDSGISKKNKRNHLYSQNPNELTLISHQGFNNLEKEIIDFLKNNDVMVVIDEAHRIKNVEGVWGRSVIEIAKFAKSRIVLTGTPIPNGYEDLYNLFQFLYPYKFKDILKTNYGQLERLTKRNATYRDDSVKNFTDNIKPYFVRIKKNDLKLPPYKEKSIYVEMDDLQKEIYDFIEAKYVKYFQNTPSAAAKEILNKARLIRLRQAATNPSLLRISLSESFEGNVLDKRDILLEYSGLRVPDLNQKFAELDSLGIQNKSILDKIVEYENCIPKKFIEIKELLERDIFKNNGKAIIWTIFIQNAKQLKSYLKDNNIDSRLLIGEIPVEEREYVVDKFNNPNNEEFKVVIANPFSVSESISLHKGCHNAIYMERDYNAGYFMQSKDRIHRYGLGEDVVTRYFYMLSNNTIDLIISENLDKKVKRMEDIINEDIPFFKRIDDFDETDVITQLLIKYAERD